MRPPVGAICQLCDVTRKPAMRIGRTRSTPPGSRRRKPPGSLLRLEALVQQFLQGKPASFVHHLGAGRGLLKVLHVLRYSLRDLDRALLLQGRVAPREEKRRDFVIGDAELAAGDELALQEGVGVQLQLALQGRPNLLRLVAEGAETQTRVHRFRGGLVQAADEVVHGPIDVRPRGGRVKLGLVHPGVVAHDGGRLREGEVAVLHRRDRVEGVHLQELVGRGVLARHRRYQLRATGVEAEQERAQGVHRRRDGVQGRLSGLGLLALEDVARLHLNRRGRGNRGGGGVQLLVQHLLEPPSARGVEHARGGALRQEVAHILLDALGAIDFRLGLDRRVGEAEHERRHLVIRDTKLAASNEFFAQKEVRKLLQMLGGLLSGCRLVLRRGLEAEGGVDRLDGVGVQGAAEVVHRPVDVCRALRLRGVELLRIGVGEVAQDRVALGDHDVGVGILHRGDLAEGVHGQELGLAGAL
mmetsp:Transcript_120390/g.236643  ORF Transcript_120390/g.236643 Transcript_120390/m.236643 type:complete len:470 (-) Transcript_120390:346-1755(-)